MKIDLPEPPLPLQVHSRHLRDRIKAHIDANGPMKFSKFMQSCLYEPGLGYYSAGLSKLGAAGDFVTAPELGPKFGRTLARYLIEPLRALGADAQILELGPGSGALAEIILDELNAQGLQLKRYCLLEVSADLRERQRTRLKRFAERIVWLEQPPDDAWSGIVLGNEVVDALPVDLFVRRADKIQEIAVGASDALLRWVDIEPDADTRAQIDQRLGENQSLGLPEQRGEVSCMLGPWLHTLTIGLKRGAVILIDYGGSRAELNHPSRSAGTLQCHYRHRAHFDPLVLLGLQDLTALVDFTKLAEHAHEQGFSIDLYTTQAHFLIALGVADQLGTESAHQQLKSAQEIRRLTHPLEMGERFKVIAFSRDLKLPDLSHIDRSNRL